MFTSEIFRHKVIEIARGETYVRAKTHREQILKYLEAVGVNYYTNYCVAFVYWCYQNTSDNFGYNYNPMPITGSTGKLYNFAKRCGLFVDDPQYGDIYISGKKNHTGLVIKYNGKTSKTVEGNTYIGDHIWGVHERQSKDLTEAYFIRL